MENTEEVIDKVKKGFNNALLNSAYREALKDDEHLQKITQSIKVEPDSKILDLGTGAGYIAFSLAKRYPNCQITGLDIADNIIKENNKKAKEEGLSNLHFITYNGKSLPFENNSFNNIITRYALHHFPDINQTFGEISKIIEPNGQFFISDPTPNEDDEFRIIDKYMNVKDDGHVKLYDRKEFESLLNNHGFILDKCFYTEMQVLFPKKEKYLTITSSINDNMIDSYDIEIIESRVKLILKILNMSFIKLSGSDRY